MFEVAVDPDARSALVVDVVLGFAERVQIAGEAVIADRFKHLGGVLRVVDLQTVLRQPSNLFGDR